MMMIDDFIILMMIMIIDHGGGVISSYHHIDCDKYDHHLRLDDNYNDVTDLVSLLYIHISHYCHTYL